MQIISHKWQLARPLGFFPADLNKCTPLLWLWISETQILLLAGGSGEYWISMRGLVVSWWFSKQMMHYFVWFPMLAIVVVNYTNLKEPDYSHVSLG